MQGGETLPDELANACDALWSQAASAAAFYASTLDGLGVHKSVTNRILEPFLFQTIIVTADTAGYDNYFEQRCSELAQPEIRIPSELMQQAYNRSTPDRLHEGDWHLPLIDNQDYWTLVGKVGHHDHMDQEILNLSKKISVARCARVSYLTHEGKRDLDKDLELYERLTTAEPPHWSPLEHVATPSTNAAGNLTGWQQLRHIVEGQRHG